jgi:hypothetical protein
LIQKTSQSVQLQQQQQQHSKHEEQPEVESAAKDELIATPSDGAQSQAATGNQPLNA